jgi:hypothetical protein
MHLKSKKTSLIILAITALMLSRLMFVFFNDPEGPNLLVVTVAAAIVYFLSLIAYVYNLSESKKLLLAIFIQIVVVTGLSIFFK